MPSDTEPLRVAASDLERFLRRLLTAAGVDSEQTEHVAENLVWNDLVGRRNHGVERLPILLRRLAAGLISASCEVEIRRITPSIAVLDAKDGFGQHAAVLATDQAIGLARSEGVGVVGVKNSNFYGSGAYYLHRAASAGMVSIVLSNSFPKVAAAGGVKPVLGTNPLAFGAPRRDRRSLLIDMSTAALAGSTVRECAETGSSLEEGLLIDKDGAPITDPAQAKQGTLLPAAGAKGFGLALMVEILAGILTGAGVSHGVASIYENFDEAGHSGHFVLTLDIQRFMTREAFYDRLDRLTALLRASGPEGAVSLPGEARWAAYDENTKLGVPIAPHVAATLAERAAHFGIVPLPGLMPSETVG